MRKKSTFPTWIGAVSLLALYLLTGLPQSLYAQEYRHRVLFISSYHPGFPTFPKQVEGLKSTLAGQDTLLDIEFMDTKRFPQQENLDNFLNLLSRKIDQLPTYDILITGDDNALKFALQQQQTLFARIPIVFFGVNNVEFALEQNSKQLVTGVIESVSMLETLQLITRLHPQTKKIYALADGTPSGQGDLKTFYKFKQELAPVSLSHLSLEEMTFAELSSHLKTIDKQGTLLLLSAYQDKAGRNLLFDQSLKLIKQNLSGPIYHLWEHGIGDGILGGKVISHFEQGKAAAEIAIRILNGTPPEDIPVRTESPNRFIFDDKELRRLRIGTDVLPENILIKNKTESYYQQHRTEIWSTGIVFTGYSLLLIMLLGHIRRRRRAEQALGASEQKFRQLIETSPLPIAISRKNHDIIFLNKKFTETFGYSTKEIPTLKHWWLLAYPDEKYREIVRRRWNSAAAKAIREKNEITPQETTVTCKNGSLRQIVGMFSSIGDWDYVILNDITERKKAEEALIDSEQRFRTLVNQAADAIFLHDIDGNFLNVNDTAVQSLGYTRDELLQMRVMDIDPGLAETGPPQSLWQKMAPGTHVTAEGTHKRKDGTTFPVEIRIGRLDLSNRSTFLALARDITKRKKVEKELRESEKRFRSIVQYSPMGIMLYRLNEHNQLILTDANPAASSLLGTRIQDRIGMTIEEAFPPLVETQVPMYFRRACTTGASWQAEQFAYKDKEIRGTFQVYAFQIAPGKMATLFLDISERQKNLQALEGAVRDAQEAQGQIELILKSVADGLLFTDMQHRIVLMSSSAEKLLKKRLDDISMKPVTYLFENPDFRRLLVEIVSGKITAGQTEMLFPGEKDGPPKTIIAKSSLVNNRQGQKNGVITLLDDVSRERALDQMKNEFISTAAHELRTPLATVMGFIELILHERKLPEEKRTEYLSIVYNKCELLGNLVDDLLDLSRVESGQIIQIKRQKKDVVLLLQKLVDSFSRSRNQKTFRLHVPEHPIIIQVDEGKFSQVISNLLSNALKFSPAESPILIECKQSETDVLITVSDRGIGMTPEQLERIFDKFYRVDATDTAQGGLGLGMAITKGIIEAHNGKIRVDSEPGQGTTVCFSLPLDTH